jgi:hypothetical protein
LRIRCFPRHLFYFSRFDSDRDRVFSNNDSACDRNHGSPNHWNHDSTSDNDSSGYRNYSRETSRFNRLNHNDSSSNFSFIRDDSSSGNHDSSNHNPSDYWRRDNAGGYASSCNAVGKRV